MRIVACFLVIVNHTGESLFRDRGPSFTWFAGLFYFFICKIAVPLFLMIMGAVLLEKMDTEKKAAYRIFKGTIVLVAASAIYYIYYGVKKGEELHLIAFIQKIMRTNVTTAFWYLYLYIGLLCLLPILQKLVKALNKRDIQWLLFLSVGILGTFPLLHIFVPEIGLSGHFTGVLFSTYIGVMLAGYFTEKYGKIDWRKFWIAVLLFVLLIGLEVILTYYLYQKDPNKYLYLDNRNFITITGSAVCFYIMVKTLFSNFRMDIRLTGAINYLGSLTFGIYLLSDLMIALTKPIHSFLCARLHVILAMGIWELIIFVMCAVITAGLKQLPGLKRWL